MITFKQRGNFNKTDKFLKQNIVSNHMPILERYGKEGVDALSAVTPMDSGNTAQSWRYEITKTRGGVAISWSNSNVSEGVPVAILIQYGHATKNGGYVQGRDFINPALRPIFDKIADELWREVIR